MPTILSATTYEMILNNIQSILSIDDKLDKLPASHTKKASEKAFLNMIQTFLVVSFVKNIMIWYT